MSRKVYDFNLRVRLPEELQTPEKLEILRLSVQGIINNDLSNLMVSEGKTLLLHWTCDKPNSIE